ncbi:hypothetical protein [Shouchella clausii]|uniref:hypothetical protein n=1 Tax=Shouchella clausii TaxID=79880 RepID=UPI00226CE632|nr:hypothetical protein [Shouchella clausii]MCY1105804.1 hypothetical protein [Shouchella clausii]
MTKFLLVYLAVILGVATYFYMRKKLRKWRERREERINAQPVIYYVYERHFETCYFVEVFSNQDDAIEFMQRKRVENDNELIIYGIMRHREKQLVKKGARR